MNDAGAGDAFHKSSFLLAISLAIGISFDFLVFDTGVGIGLSLFILLLAGGLIAVCRRWEKGLSTPACLLLIACAFFAVMLSVRNSYLLSFLNSVAAFLLLLLIAEISMAKELSRMTTLDYFAVGLVPFKFLQPLRETLASVKPERPLDESERARAPQIARGVLLAIPFLLVFTLLFSSADVVFADYLESMFHYETDPEIAARIFLVVLTALVVAGAYSFVVRSAQGVGSWREWLSPLERRYEVLGQMEVKILLGSLCALFLTFILVQVTYLFGGERNIVIPGVTYADYARNGFFQLIAVALLSFGILWAIDHFVEMPSERGVGWFRVLSSVMIVEVFVIMASAFKRLTLYESAYGFTTMRLYVHVFIIFLAVVFSLLMHKIVGQRTDAQFALRTLVAMIVFLAGMNLLDPDAFIVRRNAERYAATGKLDAYYIASLSTDAVPEVVRSLAEPIRIQKGEAANQIMACLTNRRERDPFRWQSSNLSRHKAALLREAYPTPPDRCFEVLRSY